MTTDRYQRGLDTMMEYTATGSPGVATHLRIADDLKDIAPDVPATWSNSPSVTSTPARG